MIFWVILIVCLIANGWSYLCDKKFHKWDDTTARLKREFIAKYKDATTDKLAAAESVTQELKLIEMSEHKMHKWQDNDTQMNRVIAKISLICVIILIIAVLFTHAGNCFTDMMLERQNYLENVQYLPENPAILAQNDKIHAWNEIVILFTKIDQNLWFKGLFSSKLVENMHKIPYFSSKMG